MLRACDSHADNIKKYKEQQRDKIHDKYTLKELGGQERTSGATTGCPRTRQGGKIWNGPCYLSY